MSNNIQIYSTTKLSSLVNSKLSHYIKSTLKLLRPPSFQLRYLDLRSWSVLVPLFLQLIFSNLLDLTFALAKAIPILIKNYYKWKNSKYNRIPNIRKMNNNKKYKNKAEGQNNIKMKFDKIENKLKKKLNKLIKLYRKLKLKILKKI